MTSIALQNFRAAPVHEVTLAGTTLRYREFGSGPAVLFLHGWPLSGVTYRHLIEALRPHYRCLVPDLPGAGDTPWSPRIHETIQGYTELAHAFVDHLQLERLALIGHDSGGGVARTLAAELGTRVTSLVLQNTELPAHVPLMVRLLKISASSAVTGSSLALVAKHRALRRSELGFGGCFGDLELIDGEFLEACVAPLLAEVEGHRQVLAHLDLTWTQRLAQIHERIEAPIHLFWGEQDGFFPLARARSMAQTFKVPGEFKVIAGAKLYVHEEAPAELASFTSPLLASAFGASPQLAARGEARRATLQS